MAGGPPIQEIACESLFHVFYLPRSYRRGAYICNTQCWTSMSLNSAVLAPQLLDCHLRYICVCSRLPGLALSTFLFSMVAWHFWEKRWEKIKCLSCDRTNCKRCTDEPRSRKWQTMYICDWRIKKTRWVVLCPDCKGEADSEHRHESRNEPEERCRDIIWAEVVLRLCGLWKQWYDPDFEGATSSVQDQKRKAYLEEAPEDWGDEIMFEDI